MDTLISRAAPPTSPPACIEGEEPKKKAYCYGAKPFIPIVGHCIQLAKSIEQLLTTEVADANLNTTSGGGGTGTGANGTNDGNKTNTSDVNEISFLTTIETREDLKELLHSISATTNNSTINSPNINHEEGIGKTVVNDSENLIMPMESSNEEVSGVKPVPSTTTLYSKWKQFVSEYSQYFVKEEPLVIVMPANGSDTVSLRIQLFL